jgi:hypothetical protein
LKISLLEQAWSELATDLKDRGACVEALDIAAPKVLADIDKIKTPLDGETFR